MLDIPTHPPLDSRHCGGCKVDVHYLKEARPETPDQGPPRTRAKFDRKKSGDRKLFHAPQGRGPTARRAVDHCNLATILPHVGYETKSSKVRFANP